MSSIVDGEPMNVDIVPSVDGAEKEGLSTPVLSELSGEREKESIVGPNPQEGKSEKRRRETMRAPRKGISDMVILAAIYYYNSIGSPLQGDQISQLGYLYSPTASRSAQRRWLSRFRKKYSQVLRVPLSREIITKSKFHYDPMQDKKGKKARYRKRKWVLDEIPVNVMSFDAKPFLTAPLNAPFPMLVIGEDGMEKEMEVHSCLSVYPFVTGGGEVLSVHILAGGEKSTYRFDEDGSVRECASFRLNSSDIYSAIGKRPTNAFKGYDFYLHLCSEGEINQVVCKRMLEMNIADYRAWALDGSSGVLFSGNVQPYFYPGMRNDLAKEGFKMKTLPISQGAFLKGLESNPYQLVCQSFPKEIERVCTEHRGDIPVSMRILSIVCRNIGMICVPAMIRNSFVRSGYIPGVIGHSLSAEKKKLFERAYYHRLVLPKEVSIVARVLQERNDHELLEDSVEFEPYEKSEEFVEEVV